MAMEIEIDQADQRRALAEAAEAGVAYTHWMIRRRFFGLFERAQDVAQDVAVACLESSMPRGVHPVQWGRGIAWKCLCRAANSRWQFFELKEPWMVKTGRMGTASPADELLMDAEAAVDASRVRERLAVLPARQRRVMELVHGLADGREHTQAEAGRDLGVSRFTVSRLEAEAMAKLQKLAAR